MKKNKKDIEFKKTSRIKKVIEDNKILNRINEIAKVLIKFLVYITFQLFYHWKIVIIILSIFGIKLLNTNKKIFSNILNNDFIKKITLNQFHHNIYLPLYIIEGLLLFVLGGVLIRYFKVKNLKQNKIRKIKNFRNQENGTPYFLYRNRLWSNLKIAKWTFNANGINIKKWKEPDMLDSLETNFNRIIISIDEVDGTKDKMVMTSIDPRYKTKKIIEWKDEKLSSEDFKIVLGENIRGKILVNLDKTPHLLIGGVTGSGKTG